MRIAFFALSCFMTPTSVECLSDLLFPHYKIYSLFSHFIIQLFYYLAPLSLIILSFYYIAFSLINSVIFHHLLSCSFLIIQSFYHVVLSSYSLFIIFLLITQSFYHIFPSLFSSLIISSPYYIVFLIYSPLITLFLNHIVLFLYNFFIIQFPYYIAFSSYSFFSI